MQYALIALILGLSACSNPNAPDPTCTDVPRNNAPSYACHVVPVFDCQSDSDGLHCLAVGERNECKIADPGPVTLERVCQ
jgi:hypothetical protein